MAPREGRHVPLMQTVRIRLLWHPQAQFAGYHLAEHLKLAAPAGVDLRCQPIRFDQGGMAALRSGDVEMAVASPSHLLESEIASELRFILAIQQESSLVYPVRADSGIASPVHLAGRKVGVWPGHEDLELRWMLKKAGLADGAVTRQPMADTVKAFLAGEVDCAQMTTYHELHEAERALGPGGLRVIAAHEFDASLLKDGLIVRRDWLAANRKTAQAAVDAVMQGWTIAFTEPERAIAICADLRPDMTREAQRAQLADIRDLSCRNATLTHGLGYPDPRHVSRALSAMADLGLAAPAVAVHEIADASLWQAVPAAWRAKTWAHA